ncbi:unnamed protein product, partial [Meganyctiphanes norvegica]
NDRSYGRPSYGAAPTDPPTLAPAAPGYYNEFAETTDPISMRQTAAGNLQNIQNNFNFEFSNIVRSLSAKVEFYSSVTRTFEAIFTWASDGEGDLFYSKFQLGVFQNAIKGEPP